MKKLALFLLAASCLLMCACSGLPSAVQTPAPAGTAAPSAAPAPTPSPHVTATPQASATPEDINPPETDDYLAAEAEACRIVMDDAEYFLDTSCPLELYPYMPEFPLCKKDFATGWYEYLGTTGFTFQYFCQHIYIRSDMLMEDYPNGMLTRVVDLETGVITPFGRNVNIFIPTEGETVYFTYDMYGSIYISDASLTHIRELAINVPDQEEIDEASENMFDVYSGAGITNVENGWIYFSYYVGIYEGGGIYEGNYRIRTDGTGLEKTDEGQFCEE